MFRLDIWDHAFCSGREHNTLNVWRNRTERKKLLGGLLDGKCDGHMISAGSVRFGLGFGRLRRNPGWDG